MDDLALNEDDICRIVTQVITVPDGSCQVCCGPDRDFKLFIVTIPANELENTCLVDSLYYPPKVETGLINYDFLKQVYGSTTMRNGQEVWLEICQRFGVTYVGIEDDTPRVYLQDSSCLPHFLPVVCVINSKKTCRFVYHSWTQQEKLNTFALFPHHNLLPHSQIFDLIVYQLVQIYDSFASRAIYPIFSPHLLYSDENYWLTVGLHAIFQDNCFMKSSTNEKISEEEDKLPDSTRLWEMTNAWCNSEISNFDYLMKLNEFAGHVRGDPHRHPIFPWVSDFKNETSLRPLDRTKYRLAKGDDQLNEQYSKQHPAHHVPEFLSDICYMVYRARIEKKEDLCKVVRSQWVPEEYPSSMSRLYDWTPDECIPEFYEDVNLFQSIHTDMADLQLPSWTKTPEEFVKWHRNMLESDNVSEKLHGWIDLVFGYLLTGENAIKALNVQLSMVQKPESRLRTHGAVQLFKSPHPKRKIPRQGKVSIFTHPSYTPAYCNPSILIVREHLVTDGEPFNLGGLVTELYKRHNSKEDYVDASLKSIGVTIVELALAEFCNDLTVGASFKDRLTRAQDLLITRTHRIPGNLQKSLQSLLKVESNVNNAIKTRQLKNSVLNIFALPSFIPIVHEKLAKFYYYSKVLKFEDKQGKGNVPANVDEQISIIWSLVECEGLNSLWLDIFIDLLTNSKHAAIFCHRLFWRISEFSSDSQLKRAIPAIAKLYDGLMPSSAKLFDRRFLLQLSIRFGSGEFFSQFLPPIIEAILSPSEIISGVAKESILWLTRRYGPVVTATQITTSLLRLLALCYSETSQLLLETDEMSLDVTVAGDTSCENILDCLVEIAVIYGPAFITMQYIPYCADLVDQAIRRLTSPLESAIISAMLMLKVACDCLSDKQLMDHLQELVIDQVLFPAVRLLSSTNFTFASERHRKLFTCKAIRSLHLLACRIGAENVQRHMHGVIQRLFCTFNLVYDLEERIGGEPRVLIAENAPKQLISTFTPGFARLLVQIFSAVCGRQYITGSLPNSTLISKLAYGSAYASTTSPTSPSKPISIDASRNILPGVSDGSLPFGMSPVLSSSLMLSSSMSGNRLMMFTVGEESSDVNIGMLASSFDPTSNLTLNQKMRDVGFTHLTGSWIDRFRSALSSTSEKVSFDQIQLCTFTGHTSNIRKIIALDNENSFVSASADKTVKLWSIKTVEESSSCQWTYKAHSKPVQDVCLLKFGTLIASTDGSSHIWDPFRGSALHQLDWPLGGSDAAITCLSTMSHNTLVATSNVENIVRLFDIRSGQWIHHICAWTWTSAASIRAIAVSPDTTKFSVALTNGSTSVIDARTGRILAYSVLHHSDAIQVDWLTSDLFACTHADHPVVLWSTVPRLKIVKRLNEVANFVTVCGKDQYATLQSPYSKIRLYDKDECHNEIKIKSDFIAGSVSALEYLKLNRMFLVGSSQGMIRLAC